MNRLLLLLLLAAAVIGSIFLLNRDGSEPARPPEAAVPSGGGDAETAAPDPMRASGGVAPDEPRPPADAATKEPQQPAPVRPAPSEGPAPFRLDPQVDSAFVEETTEILREQAYEIDTEQGRRALTPEEIAVVGQELELARRSIRSALDTGADVGELAHLFEQLGGLMRTERLLDRVELRERGGANPGLMRVRSASGGEDRMHRFIVETGKVRIDLKVSRDAAHHWKIPISGAAQDWQTTLQR